MQKVKIIKKIKNDNQTINFMYNNEFQSNPSEIISQNGSNN